MYMTIKEKYIDPFTDYRSLEKLGLKISDRKAIFDV
jgi:hypothetical protein